MKVLICGTNWLGDSVIAMPAVRLFRRLNPGAVVTMMVRPALADLWRSSGDVNEVIHFRPGLPGTFLTAAAVRKAGFDAAFVFPNSFRAAFVPFLAGIRVRRGARGHARAWMLTDVADLTRERERHQSLEYVNILQAGGGELPAPPYLRVGAADAAWAGGAAAGAGASRLFAVLPGAARGPSKQWPADRFAAAGRRLVGESDCAALVLGSEGERAACEAVCSGIGPRAVNLCGRTTVMRLAALLSLCRCALSNDSGGMHLAAAVGTPVVAVYGLTDSGKTGPLGSWHVIVQADGVKKARDIKRRSAEAEAALAAIAPDRVFDAAVGLIRDRG